MIESSDLAATLQNTLAGRPRRDRVHRLSLATVAIWVLAPWCLAAETVEKRVRAPVTLQLLERRAQYQQSAANAMTAFRDFRFTNQIETSGIRFRHQFVDDAGRDYKAVQYDHGNGVAVADVDADGKPDLYFTTQLGSNSLWRNLGGGRFEDITARAGIGMPDQISVAAAFGDIDNDGAPDLFVTTVRHGNRLFRNLGGGRFEDITGTAGVGYSGHSSGAMFFDYDRDGWLDLFVSNVGVYTGETKGRGGYYIGLTNAFDGHLFPERSEASLLYRNLGDRRFREVSTELNLRDVSWNGEATAVDVNDDGFQDLYLANMQGDDRLYENQAGKRFIENTAAYFPKTPWGSVGVKAFDANRDGRVDLYVTDMHSDMTKPQTEAALSFRPDLEKSKSEAYCTVQWTDAYLQGGTNNLFGNALFLGQEQRPFAEASQAFGAETYWPWGPSAGDLNADGFEDVFVTAGMGYPFRYAMNSVLINEGGRRFFDAEFLLGVEPRAGGWLGREWFTLDCSGADREHPGCAGKSGVVSVPGSSSTRSSVIFDLDDDGDLDLVTLEFGDQPQVLVSNLSAKRPPRFVKVKLTGQRSNRDGLGAKVRITAGGKSSTQWNDGKSGYLAQSVLPLYFGLGDTAAIESLEVTWPSGVRQVRTNDLRLGRLIEITEAP